MDGGRRRFGRGGPRRGERGVIARFRPASAANAGGGTVRGINSVPPSMHIFLTHTHTHTHLPDACEATTVGP